MFFHDRESIFNFNTVVGCITVRKYYNPPPPHPQKLGQWRALELGVVEESGRRRRTQERGCAHLDGPVTMRGQWGSLVQLSDHDLGCLSLGRWEWGQCA